MPVAYFKFFLAPANDVMAGDVFHRMAQLFDGNRHGIILAALSRDIARFGEWRVLPYLAMALPFFAWKSRRRFGPGEIVVPLVLVAMLVGYYAVYLLTPQEREQPPWSGCSQSCWGRLADRPRACRR